ncbi:S-adenosyl-L-methionine-dependent methyltransferase [Saccharata proteae CBS 121410]|uniref:S-adenosyl-L-methionine-dependent methyltransferase n=1 Tax=Saccharata proteae CBS 121410 TaxID=1314787 RepID=A0A9P4LXB5_9PEZI|nr:S-adenosyl-L-methionine-dependent methyltransferase [Saccharata proteae CBS 121410]
MDTSSPLESLADQALLAAKQVDGFFSANGLAQPSFEERGPPGYPKMPSDIQAARLRLRDAAKALYDLATGPDEGLRWISTEYADLATLRFIDHFNLAEAVPLGGEKSFTDIAAERKLHAGQVKRVLRHAMTNNIFMEKREGYVSHSATSKALLTDKSIRAWVSSCTELFTRSSTGLVEATERWGWSEKRNETPFNISYQTDLGLFEWWTEHPEKGARFATSLKGMAQDEVYSFQHMADGFDWQSLGNALVVDIGGSAGQAAITLTKSFPNLKCIVQDLSEIVEQGRASLPETLQDRVEFQTHNFFDPQPVEDADVYCLRFVCHDWGDSYVEKILKNIIMAMKPGARIVIMDQIMPQPNTLPKCTEKTMRFMDIQMMLHMAAAERELSDWETLFQQTDPRLELKNVKTPAGSALSVMELGIL